MPSITGSRKHAVISMLPRDVSTLCSVCGHQVGLGGRSRGSPAGLPRKGSGSAPVRGRERTDCVYTLYRKDTAAPPTTPAPAGVDRVESYTAPAPLCLLLRSPSPVAQEAAAPRAGWQPSGVRTSAGSMPKRPDFTQNPEKKRNGKNNLRSFFPVDSSRSANFCVPAEREKQGHPCSATPPRASRSPRILPRCQWLRRGRACCRGAAGRGPRLARALRPYAFGPVGRGRGRGRARPGRDAPDMDAAGLAGDPAAHASSAPALRQKSASLADLSAQP